MKYVSEIIAVICAIIASIALYSSIVGERCDTTTTRDVIAGEQAFIECVKAAPNDVYECGRQAELLTTAKIETICIKK